MAAIPVRPVATIEIMTSEDLLSLTRKELAIPVGQPTTASTQPASASDMPVTQEWRQLYRALNELEAGAQAVGKIPQGYPRHVDWVMRILHALLPWYTRPLQKHAEHTVAVCRSVREVLTSVIATQHQLAARVEQLERQHTSSQNPGAPAA